MFKKLILTLTILFILVSAPYSQASGLFNTGFKMLHLSRGDNIFDSKTDWSKTMSMKSGVTYDEAKDPALRQGTENWEEPQGSFFIIPALLVGVFALILFFNRK